MTFVSYSPDVQQEKQMQDQQRMTSERMGTPNARSLRQQHRQERECALWSMQRASLRGFVQLMTPPSTQRDLRQSDGAFHFSFNSSLRSHMLSRPDTKRSTHDPSTHSGSPQSE